MALRWLPTLRVATCTRIRGSVRWSMSCIVVTGTDTTESQWHQSTDVEEYVRCQHDCEQLHVCWDRDWSSSDRKRRHTLWMLSSHKDMIRVCCIHCGIFRLQIVMNDQADHSVATMILWGYVRCKLTSNYIPMGSGIGQWWVVGVSQIIKCGLLEARYYGAEYNFYFPTVFYWHVKQTLFT